MARHTWASRGAVALTAVLAALELYAAGVRSGSGIVVWGWALLGALTLLAAMALARVNCFETRLAVTLVCAAELGLVLLALVTGLPGQSPKPMDAEAAVALLVSTTALVLLALHRRARRTGSADHDGAPTYAR
ncbi:MULTISPECIES: hypothetical protein [Nocardioides]|uniref:Histidine kinase n=1 Tax=Nocardioides vastitatis TaxID=2568655 RepID=A0ABW0ZJZ2_9ACTN|nr:hypothetical protein [Nocardioides sp.]THI92343.1 hypothetical protein E7Z54_21980 [Nocardioides sp.]